ncbi:acyltransferase, WS/DGAT/MGAT [Polaribacter sp. KT25b]|uniref:WS/DGAT domain-containing protein n=1 Tax=Polaribacter sp. KT25b TaxID=1855336 RepID=UPI00087DAD47|nr:WS/DGAT domain-containing protein [Polaribacter sp. KT25b]SDS25173.1 acyltransferase, WS/DGAT/MGAT [Polaribacter sp. KT25b]
MWSIDFIEGLDEVAQVPKGSIAILSKIHHVMIDGSSGVGLMSILFDKNKEEKEKKPSSPKPFEPEPLPDEISLLIKSSYSFFKNPFKVPKLIGETAFSFLKVKMNNQLRVKRTSFKSSYSTPKTIFNECVSPKRTWGTAILAFDRINKLRKIIDVSVNDLILAICAGAIRRYLEEKEKLPVQPLVANVPISIRTKGEEQKMNNQISNMFIKIGTHIKNPLDRLDFIQEQTSLGKSKHKAVGAKTLSKMADAMPFGLANLAASLYSKYNIKEFHRPPFNVTITNVPGPQNPLYLKGHKVVGIFGLAPVLDGFGLIIAAFSYNGLVSITTTSDAKTMPDADKFSRYIRESANELEALILTKEKQKTVEKVKKIKSSVFFTAFKKYLIADKNLREQIIGLYDFHLNLGESEINYQLAVLKETVSVKKKKTAKPSVKIIIDDNYLINLHKKNLLLEEAIIQERLFFTGTKKNIDKFSQILSEFLEKN